MAENKVDVPLALKF
jgi:acyl dehydratase